MFNPVTYTNASMKLLSNIVSYRVTILSLRACENFSQISSGVDVSDAQSKMCCTQTSVSVEPVLALFICFWSRLISG